MKPITSRKLAGLSVLLALPTLGVTFARAQAGDPPPLKLSAADDHQAMMDKLHIPGALRPGAAGGQGAVNDPNYANYDEAKAKAKSPVPDLLTMANGQKITTAAQWAEHRKELYELFDSQIYGRVPEAAKHVKVTWTVTSTSTGMSGTTPTLVRQLSGHVDNSFYPQIEVNITASVTTPLNAKGPVPVVIVFGGGGGGGAPRGGAGGGGAGLPALAQMTTQLTLTDAQIALITPILDGYTKMQGDVTKATTALGVAKTTATDGLCDRHSRDLGRYGFAHARRPPGQREPGADPRRSGRDQADPRRFRQGAKRLYGCHGRQHGVSRLFHRTDQ
jgi:hypothetical protein